MASEEKRVNRDFLFTPNQKKLLRRSKRGAILPFKHS